MLRSGRAVVLYLHRTATREVVQLREPRYSEVMETTNYTEPMTQKPRYLSANLIPTTASRLRILAAQMIGETGGRVTTSALIDALLDVGETHRAELINRLKGEETHNDEAE